MHYKYAELKMELANFYFSYLFINCIIYIDSIVLNIILHIS